MSTLKVDGIRSNSATSDAITLADNGTCTANITNNLSNRNLIINGAMQVAQRGTSSTSTGIKTADRFQILNANTDNFAFTQKQVTDSPDGFGNSYEIDVTTAESVLAADEYSLVRTTLEANTLQSLAFGTSSAKQITLSFYVKAYQTGTYASSIFIGDSGRAYTVNYTINQSATWERKTITFAGDTSGAIANDNGVGCYINWHIAAGTDYTSSTAHKNQWATFANASWAHGQTVNVLSSTDNYWKITGVQLEVGSVATDFEHRSYAQELTLAERYFEICAGGSVEYVSATGGYLEDVVQHRTVKRANPTVTLISSSENFTQSISAVGGDGNSKIYQSALRANNAVLSGGIYYYYGRFSADSEL